MQGAVKRCAGDERCAIESCLDGDILDRLARSETSSAACRDDGVGVAAPDVLYDEAEDTQCDEDLALGDTLSSSEALGAQRGKRFPSNVDVTFRDDLISYLSKHY